MKTIYRFNILILAFIVVNFFYGCKGVIKVYESETRIIPLSLNLNTFDNKKWESVVTKNDVQKALNIPSDAKKIKVTLKSIKLKIEPDANPKNAPFIEYSMNVIAPEGQGYHNFLKLSSYEVTKFLGSASPIHINLKAQEIANLNGLLSRLFDPKAVLQSVKFDGAIDGKLQLNGGPNAVFIGKLIVNLALDISYYHCEYTDAASFIDDNCE
ncbi:MAG: hypothetical protein IPF46_12545 [Saprospiraceae bacterium]|nr:hypothetical protein [Candidatus Vicinibacter affinis]